ILVGMSYSYSSDGSGLQKVAESEYQWTGIAVSAEKRIFVNYPTWKVPSPFKVAELVGGKRWLILLKRTMSCLFVCKVLW
ncbi:MAG: hypothetical protein LUE93_15535, partial [Bacteroides sp.]|nr:hypothetical protein [Bacteroides sp.]